MLVFVFGAETLVNTFIKNHQASFMFVFMIVSQKCQLSRMILLSRKNLLLYVLTKSYVCQVLWATCSIGWMYIRSDRLKQFRRSEITNAKITTYVLVCSRLLLVVCFIHVACCCG